MRTSAKLAAGVLSPSTPADGSITSTMLQDACVTTAKLANNSVDLNKLETFTRNYFINVNDARLDDRVSLVNGAQWRGP